MPPMHKWSFPKLPSILAAVALLLVAYGAYYEWSADRDADAKGCKKAASAPGRPAFTDRDDCPPTGRSAQPPRAG
jgi:hypothetical protein